MDDAGLVRAMLAEAMHARGVTGAMPTVEPDGDGRVRVMRHRHVSEGGPKMTGGSFETVHASARVAAIAATLARLGRRDRTLSALGIPLDAPPAWAHVVDATTRAIVGRLGGDIDVAARWQPASNRINGRDTGLMARDFPAGVAIGACASMAFRTEARIYHLSVDDGSLYYWDHGGRPTIVVKARLPDTLAAAAGGRRLGDVLDHRLTNGIDAVVDHVEVDEDSDHLGIILRPAMERLQVAPDGVDAEWVEAEACETRE